MGTFRLTLSRLRVGRNYLTLSADQLSAGPMTSRLAFGNPVATHVVRVHEPSLVAHVDVLLHLGGCNHLFSPWAPNSPASLPRGAFSAVPGSMRQCRSYTSL